jgi:hypothetical protein
MAFHDPGRASLRASRLHPEARTEPRPPGITKAHFARSCWQAAQERVEDQGSRLVLVEEASRTPKRPAGEPPALQGSPRLPTRSLGAASPLNDSEASCRFRDPIHPGEEPRKRCPITTHPPIPYSFVIVIHLRNRASSPSRTVSAGARQLLRVPPAERNRQWEKPRIFGVPL